MEDREGGRERERERERERVGKERERESIPHQKISLNIILLTP